MTASIEYIDQQIAKCLKVTKKYYGLCEQVTSEGETFPRTIADSERVNPDDSFEFATYHRVVSGSSNGDENFSWGRKRSRRHVFNMRMVVMLSVDLGEDYLNKIVDAIPTKIPKGDADLKETGEEFSIIMDQYAVAEQEFGEAWADKHIMSFNLYAVEYTIEILNCPTCK